MRNMSGTNFELKCNRGGDCIFTHFPKIMFLLYHLLYIIFIFLVYTHTMNNTKSNTKYSLTFFLRF